MRVTDFVANLINYYYPISDFVKAAFIKYLVDKKFSERDFDKIYAWLLKNYSRKWKTTPDIAIIEEAEKAINDFANKYGTKKDALNYGIISKRLPEPQKEQEKDYSKEINAIYAKFKEKIKQV